MDKTTYENLKIDFKNLTGKNADDNLEAYLNYLVLLSNMDLKDYLKEIRFDVNTITKKV
jgi:hypothetical protein